MSNGSSLSLDYAFVSTPTPVLASPVGGNANTVELTVTVSAPSYGDATISSVAIQIPIGDATSGALSNSKTLPPVTPTTIKNSQGTSWSITLNVDTVTIAPIGPNTGTVTGDNPIVFSIQGIQVNEAPGTVNFQITEYLPDSQGSNFDNTTYTLVKQPWLCPLVSFTVSPSTLNNVDESVTLSWACTSNGQTDDKYTYKLSASLNPSLSSAERSKRSASPDSVAPSFSPPPGTNGGYTADAGKTGVTYSPVSGSTTFTVNAQYAQSVGDVVDAGTLTAGVQVLLPSFATTTFAQPSVSGHFASLHWSTYNANSCTIQVDGVATGDTLPADTYETGAWVMLAATPSSHELVGVARAQVQNGYPVTAQSTTFQVDTRSATTITISDAPMTVAVTPDSTLALIGSVDEGTDDGTIYFLDLQTLTLESTTLQVGSGAPIIAITSDSKTAVVASMFAGTVSRIDIPTRSLVGTPISLSTPETIALTPDGKLALVGEMGTQCLDVIDLATWTAEAKQIPIGPSPGAIAVAPNGTVALVPDLGTGTVAFIDIANRTSDMTSVTFGQETDPSSVAFSPDGSRAFVPCMASNKLAIIDVPGRKVESTPIPDGNQPSAIAMTPDGRYAFITNYQGATMNVFDVEHQTTSTLPVGTRPTAVALAPRGTAIVVACGPDNTVWVY